MTESSENLAEFRQMLISHANDEPMEVRLAAIKAIDNTLQKRGQLNLISGQPLHIVQRRPEPVNGPPKKKPKRADHSARPTSLQPTTGSTSKSADRSVVPEAFEKQVKPTNDMVIQPQDSSRNGNAQKSAEMSGPRLFDWALSEPSKRTSPFPDNSSMNKRPKQSVDLSCVVCGRTPHHLVKDCPIVIEGPGSVTREIKRLDKHPSMSGTVSILRNILSKQKRKALECMAD